MLAIIPARGGSKGLPGKNILPLCGKPLIAHTIEAALNADSIDCVVVSTDCAEIAETALNYGASVPFMRPVELARDDSMAIDTYLYTVERLERTNEPFIVLLPTTPLRTTQHIDAAVSLFEIQKARTLISVVEAPVPPSWYLRKTPDGRLVDLWGRADIIKNRQTQSSHYIPNGAIYILDYRLLKEERTYYCDNTVGYVMPRDVSVDIDDQLDFDLAEIIMGKRAETTLS